MPFVPTKTQAAAAAQYPRLNAILNEIEETSRSLELEDGRYAYVKYLEPIYSYHWKSMARGTQKRDRSRICKLRALKTGPAICLFGALLRGTSKISKSTRGKYVKQLRQATKLGVKPRDLRDYLKSRNKQAAAQPRSSGRGARPC